MKLSNDGNYNDIYAKLKAGKEIIMTYFEFGSFQLYCVANGLQLFVKTEHIENKGIKLKWKK